MNEIEPQRVTARTLAKVTGWSVAKAAWVLEGFWERGLVKRGPDDSYLISGKGLFVGEQMGVVKPFDRTHGYFPPSREIDKVTRTLDGGAHPFIKPISHKAK